MTTHTQPLPPIEDAVLDIPGLPVGESNPAYEPHQVLWTARKGTSAVTQGKAIWSGNWSVFTTPAGLVLSGAKVGAVVIPVPVTLAEAFERVKDKPPAWLIIRDEEQNEVARYKCGRWSE